MFLNQERRPSGVLPMSYMNMTKKEDEFKKRMMQVILSFNYNFTSN